LKDQFVFDNMQENAASWSGKYTLDLFEEEIKTICNRENYQIIDSLEAGGSDVWRLAMLTRWQSKSIFRASSNERRFLTVKLSSKVDYLFLNKKSGFASGICFKKVHCKNRICSSLHLFFIGFLLKLIYPSIRMLWHDHYGNSEFLKLELNFHRLTLPFF
jgi:hypothetical protein